MAEPRPLTQELSDKLQSALKQSFDPADLRRFATERLAFDDVKFADEVGFTQAKSKIVFELVEVADQRHRVGELVLALAQARPRRPDVLALVSEFGLAPDVKTETAGVGIKDALVVDRDGFEKTIKGRLPMFDFGVWREKMGEIEGRVCEIEIDGNAAGTGFLVGPDAVLTNYHVLASVILGQTAPAKVICQFDYKVMPDGTRMKGTSVPLDPEGWKLDFSPPSAAEKANTPDRTLPTTDELDYALVKLARAVGSEPALSRVGAAAPRRGWVSMPITPPILLPRTPLLIAEHPDGKPLKLSIDTDAVISVNDNGTRVRYTNNTEPGSSGSPVFDMDWNLVALHHMGDPAYDHPASYNQGVVIHPIRERIEARGRGDSLGT